VTGVVITSPARNVTPADRVTVDGKPLPMRERTRLFLFHKPRGLVTTHADPEGRQTVFDALPKHLPRLISVGRLDANTEGLLLLTNDGGLARALELPATGWTRRYRVRAHGKITQPQLDQLRHGVEIDGVRYGSIEARLDREQGANVWLTFAMREGKNREVKNVLGHLGLAVNRLIRLSFGPFQLGELPVSAVEEVRTRHLREQLGERIANAAGLDFSGPVSDQDRSPRPHPEVPAESGPRTAAARPGSGMTRRQHEKGDDRRQPRSRGRASPDQVGGRPFAARAKARPPQADGERKIAQPQSARSQKKPRRKVSEHIGEPERARRERKRGKRPLRTKRR
jgi:23S rRNA pseudouridine2605 synthase